MVEEFKNSIRLRPNEPETYLGLGRIEVERDRTTEGIEHLWKPLEAEPENPLALGILAYQAITVANEVKARQWPRRGMS